MRDPEGVFERILVGTDGSETATRAVDRAVELAKACGASVTVLCAGPAALTAEVLGRESARLDIDVETIAFDRDPASAIVEAAAGGAFDLVVLGNQGMTGPDRFQTLGSVPNKVSHRLPVSLLIVRTVD